MDVITIFVIAAIIIFLGFLGEIVFKKTNIPDVIWLILFGIIIGSVFKIVDISGTEETAAIFTTFALIFLLFEGAININLKELFKGMFGGTSLTLINFILSVIVVTLLGILFGLPIMLALLLGTIISGTSSAVVIPIIRRLKLKSETTTMLTIESAVSDVLCIIASITIIQIIVLSSVDVSSVFNTLIGSFAIALFVGIIAGFLWIQVLKWVDQHSKSYMITIAFMLLLYGFVEFIKANGAIAALAFGLILGNSKKIFTALKDGDAFSISRSERFFYAEVSFFVKSFFFVYLGLLIDFSNLAPFIMATIIVVALFLIRPMAVYPVAKKLDIRNKAAMQALVPKGLAAAVLAQVALQSIPEAAIFTNIVLGVILISIILSSLLVFLVEKNHFHGFYHRMSLKKKAAVPKKDKKPVIDSKKEEPVAEAPEESIESPSQLSEEQKESL
jgi:NhaP-type Na+/H+ or K+/H+ antiporter